MQVFVVLAVSVQELSHCFCTYSFSILGEPSYSRRWKGAGFTCIFQSMDQSHIEICVNVPALNIYTWWVNYKRRMWPEYLISFQLSPQDILLECTVWKKSFEWKSKLSSGWAWIGVGMGFDYGWFCYVCWISMQFTGVLHCSVYMGVQRLYFMNCLFFFSSFSFFWCFRCSVICFNFLYKLLPS